MAWNDGTWDHRAVWGQPLTLSYGSVVRMGDVPSTTGQWIKLTAPADGQNLAGAAVSGMYFDVQGGKVWFDRSGVEPRPQADAVTLPGPMFSSAGSESTSTPRRYSLYTPELNLMAETSLTTETPTIAYEYVWFNGQPVACAASDGT